MALTKDEFIEKCMLVKKNQGLAIELGKQQNQEIQDLIVEYKVEECNTKRAAIISKYNALAKTIQEETQLLENELYLG